MIISMRLQPLHAIRLACGRFDLSLLSTASRLPSANPGLSCVVSDCGWGGAWIWEGWRGCGFVWCGDRCSPVGWGWGSKGLWRVSRAHSATCWQSGVGSPL